MTLIKVNQHPARLEIGNNTEEHSEGKEAEIIKIQGEALTIITTLRPGEAVEVIITELRLVNKQQTQTIDLEVDTTIKVLIIIKMVTPLEVLEVVETIKELTYHNKFKIMMMSIIVQTMQILKMMLIILLRKSQILQKENQMNLATCLKALLAKLKLKENALNLNSLKKNYRFGQTR